MNKTYEIIQNFYTRIIAHNYDEIGNNKSFYVVNGTNHSIVLEYIINQDSLDCEGEVIEYVFLYK